MKLRDLVGPLALGALALATLSACSGSADEPEAAETKAETPVAPTATPAAPAAPVDFSSLTGDATKGQKVFMQCMACHSLKQGENRVGPSLHGLIGRAAGSVAGFNYSAANKNSGMTWSKEQLFTYLEAPRKAIPGTKMVFSGLASAQDRVDLIAYIDAND